MAMINKFNTPIIVFALIWLSTSCNDQKDFDHLSTVDVPLKLVSGIKARSTIENNWETGNSIGIMMFNSKTNELTSGKSNYQYIANKNGENSSFLPVDTENTAYFPIDGTKVDIMGYYPYDASIGENLAVSINTANQTNLATLDFLTSERAYEHSSKSPEVELVFVHRLAKLDITIDAAQKGMEDELKNASLVISGTNINATWSLTTNKFESKGETGDISIPIINGKTATAIIIPTSAENQIQFILTTANSTYTAEYTKDFEEGTVNTLHLHLIESAVTITSTIKPWEEGSGSGESDLENIVTDLSLTGIKTNGIFMLGTQEETTALHTNYDYDADTETLMPANGENPIYWDMLQDTPHTFQATFIPVEETPQGHEKDILVGTSAPVPFGNSIELEMKHAMAQLIVVLSSDGSVTPAELKTASVTFSVPQYTTEISWDYIDTNIDDTRIIMPTIGSEDGLTRIATICPQTWKANALVMTLKLGDEADSKVYTLYAGDITSDNMLTGSDFVLNAGESYTLSARLAKTAVGIQVKVDDNWKEISGNGTFN